MFLAVADVVAKPESSCAMVVDRFYLDPAADLQPLARNVCLRRRYDNVLCRASTGGRFNCPVPADVAIFIEIPSSATALCDLYAPMIVIGWNCEYKCNRSRHDHSAENSSEKYASHFVCPHSLTLSSKLALMLVLYLGAIKPKRLWCANRCWNSPMIHMEAPTA